jgi:hypothetical protein
VSSRRRALGDSFGLFGSGFIPTFSLSEIGFHNVIGLAGFPPAQDIHGDYDEKTECLECHFLTSYYIKFGGKNQGKRFLKIRLDK